MTVPLRLQIQEVEREIRMRKQVYPRWITAGKMRRGEAELHIERMNAVLETLQRLEADQS